VLGKQNVAREAHTFLRIEGDFFVLRPAFAQALGPNRALYVNRIIEYGFTPGLYQTRPVFSGKSATPFCEPYWFTTMPTCPGGIVLAQPAVKNDAPAIASSNNIMLK
jgi:hypothetical protein